MSTRGGVWKSEIVAAAANAWTFTKAGIALNTITVQRILFSAYEGTGIPTLSITSGGVVIWEKLDWGDGALGAAVVDSFVIEGPFSAVVGETLVITVASTTITAGRMVPMFDQVP